MIRLTQREKLLAAALATIIAAWSLFTIAVKPVIARIETLRRVIPEKQNELEKLRARSKEYIFLRDSLAELRAKVDSQQKTFELLPFLESLIGECGLELPFLESLIGECGLEKNAALGKQQGLPLDSNYYETIVEIKLENLTLRQLVDFLRKVYIKRNPTNKDLLDSVVEIHNAKLTQRQIAHK